MSGGGAATVGPDVDIRVPAPLSPPPAPATPSREPGAPLAGGNLRWQMFPSVDITPLDLFTKASPDPVPIILISVAVGWYLWSVRRLAARGRAWPAARTAS